MKPSARNFGPEKVRKIDRDDLAATIEIALNIAVASVLTLKFEAAILPVAVVGAYQPK